MLNYDVQILELCTLKIDDSFIADVETWSNAIFSTFRKSHAIIQRTSVWGADNFP